MNNLGGMVFIVAGIAMGYWVATGKAAGFLHAVNQGSQTTGYPLGYNPNTPGYQWLTDPNNPLNHDIGNIWDNPPSSGVNPAVNTPAAAAAAQVPYTQPSQWYQNVWNWMQQYL